MSALCVFCRAHPAKDPWRPFCSERCRLQDLARWVDGAYRAPGETLESQDEESAKPDNHDD